MTPDYFRTLARYNGWANTRLYDACAKLPEAELRAPRPAFFGSILNTLNHILVTDRIWLARIEGVPSGIRALDQVLFEEFDALRAAREAEDARIIALVDGMGPDRLDDVLVYRTMVNPAEVRTPMSLVLGHIFNHQTHHRGQVHDMLCQTAVPPPPLDLIYYVREATGPRRLN